MKNLRSLLFASLLVCFSSNCTLAETGDILNLQFGGGSSTGYTNGAAIDDDAQTWNRLRSTVVTTLDNLQYANGNLATDVSLIYYAPTIGYVSTAFPSTNIDANLMKGYMTTSNKAGYLEFSGLDNGTYNLYFYSQGKKNVSSSVELIATTSVDDYDFSLSNDGKSTELIENTNWMMKNIVVSDGNLNISVMDNSVLNGIQLYQINKKIEAVPEPVSAVLIGVGGIFFFGYMKRVIHPML